MGSGLKDILIGDADGSSAGNDVIWGGRGNDILFGDMLFTDDLATAEGLSMPPGSGWAVFAELMENHGWTEAQVIAYIQNNHQALFSASSPGGDDYISGGVGNDNTNVSAYGSAPEDEWGLDGAFMWFRDGTQVEYVGTLGPLTLSANAPLRLTSLQMWDKEASQTETDRY